MKFQTFHRLLIVSFCLLFPILSSSAYADTRDNKNAVEWLFVITSKEGEIKKNVKGQYELRLKHAHIERVLAFSNRPNRIVKMISPQDFKKLWGDGKNSFEKDPPNAIAVFGQEKIAMKLMSVSLDKDKTVFVLKSDDDILRDVSMRDVSIFVDNIFVSHGIICYKRPRCAKRLGLIN